MSHRKLTGRRRYRAHSNLIVLEVEETFIVTKWSGGIVDSEWVTRWRDATIGDVTVHKEESDNETDVSSDN